MKNWPSSTFILLFNWHLMHCPVLTWHWPVFSHCLCTCASVCGVCSNHGMETARHHSHVLSSSLEHLSNGAVLQLEKGIVSRKEGHGVFNAFSTDMVLVPNLASFCTFPLNSKTVLFFETCLKTQTAMMSVADMKVLTMYSFQINNLVWLN